MSWSLKKDRKEWISSPGALTYLHETQEGNHTAQAGIHSLSISFPNAGLFPSASPSSLLDEIQLSPEEEAIELKLIIMSDLYEKAKVNHTYHKKITAEGRKDVIYDKNSTLDHEVTLPAFLNVRAVYIKGRDGEDRISGSSSYSSESPCSEIYDCPPVKTTQKWTIDLERHPKNQWP